MPPNRFESEVESFLEGSHGDRTHIKRAGHHTVTPLCGTLLVRGLQGLAGLRGDAPSEARGVDGERAGRPRAAREVWRGAPHGGLAAGCLADGERAGRRPPAHRADADNRTCWA